MKLQKLVNNLEVKKIFGEYKGEIIDVSEDSRKIKKDFLFIATIGDNFDGHNFIDQAIANGATVIVSEKNPTQDQKRLATFIIVKDSKKSAGIIFHNFYNNPSKKLKVIGVTGTNGKTTTTSFVYQMLSFLSENKASLIGTNGGIIGKKEYKFDKNEAGTTPSAHSIAKFMNKCVENGIKYVVMEVSSHGAHQQRISGINFSAGAFTNLSQDHLDYHKTMQNYAEAKKLFLKALPEKSTAVINLDNEYSNFMKKNLKSNVVTYSHKIKSNFDYHIQANDMMGLVIETKGEVFKLPYIIGSFNAENFMASLILTTSLGFSLKKITGITKKIKPPAGRLEIIRDNKKLIVVDYAHTPDGMQKVLETLSSFKKPDSRMITVFGAGGNRDKTKRPKMGEIAEKYSDEIIITSDNPRHEDPSIICQEIATGFKTKNPKIIIDRHEAIKFALSNSNDEDIVAILGKGHEKYQIINDQEIPFDDLKIAKELIK